MDCLTQQSIKVVRGQTVCFYSDVHNVKSNQMKSIRSTYGPFHLVNNAVSSVIRAWPTYDSIVVYGLVDAQQD